jgi:hypothetical protein
MASAFLHVVGSLVAYLALGILGLFIAAWEQKRIEKRRLQDAAIALGVSVASLDTDESLVPRFVEYSSQRFSSELLRNRFSDLCGALRTVWGWAGTLLQIGVMLGVRWSMYSSGAANAVYMWLVFPVAILFWIVSAAFSFACLLLTGRYPGEARMARKAIAAFIEQRSARTLNEPASSLTDP